MEKIDLNDPKYSHLHPILVTQDGGIYMDRTSSWVLKGGVFLHLELHNWSVSKFKQYLVQWEVVKETLSRAGYTSINATPPTEKEERLLYMFGLRKTGVVITGLNIMRIPLCHQQS